MFQGELILMMLAVHLKDINSINTPKYYNMIDLADLAGTLVLALTVVSLISSKPNLHDTILLFTTRSSML